MTPYQKILKDTSDFLLKFVNINLSPMSLFWRTHGKYWLFFFFFFSSVHAETNCQAVTEIPKEECEALVVFYNSTHGSGWFDSATNNWTKTNTPCSWAEISCNSSGHVISIYRVYRNLVGTLPDLSALTQLQILHLYGNQLNGTIPNLSALTQLKSLDLSINQLNGTIPNLSTLTQLQFLHLAVNQLTGTIPNLTPLTQLKSLNLSVNQLTGMIPDLSTLIQLQRLYLNYNHLSGTIPNLIALTQLLHLGLRGNHLSGTIPDLSTLTLLQTLWLDDNHLSGTIPNLSTLTQLQILYLHNNQLCGEISPSLTNVSSSLRLENNHLITSNPTLIAFLNNKNPDWTNQTPCSTPELPKVDCVATPNDPTCVFPKKVDCTVTPYDPACIISPPPTSSTLPSTLTLWINVEGLGEGKVITQENKMNCTKTGGLCQATYSTGTKVTLTPIATPGSYFSSWGGHDDCTDGQVWLSLGSVRCIAYFRANTAPTAKINVTTPVQVNQPIHFNGHFTDPDPTDTYTFAWDFGDHETDQTQNPSHTYTQAGTYSVTFTVTDNRGGKGRDQMMLEVKPKLGWIAFDPALPTPSLLPDVKILSSSAQALVVEMTTPGMEVNEMPLEPCHAVNLPNSGYTTEIGKPQVPMVSHFIGLPKGSQATLEVLDSTVQTLSGYTVCPAQEPFPEVKNAPVPPFAKDEVLYQQDQFYPTERVKLDEGEQKIRGMPVTLLRMYPIQFNPVTKTLQVSPYLKVKITFQGGQGDFTDAKRRSPAFDQILDRLLLNASTALSSEVEAAYDTGNSLLIITHPDFLSAAQTLAAWKIKKGIATQVKTTHEVGNTASAIQSYIQHAYQTWVPPPTYILLVGDAEFIPVHYQTEHSYHGTKSGTDLYYTTVDGSDDFPDIHLGRLSVDTLAEATKRVGDIINYEKATVADRSFYEKVLLASYFQDDNQDGTADRRFAQTTEDLAIYFSDPNYLGKYSVNRVYYTEPEIIPQFWDKRFFGGGPAGELGGPLPDDLKKPAFPWNGHATDISHAINQGRFLVIHRDHGDTLGWGDPHYTTTEVQALTNGNQLPVVWSVNCMSGWFDNETDEEGNETPSDAIHFSEAWERNAQGGAVGVLASTRVSYSGYNDRLTWGWTDAIWPGFIPAYHSTKGPEPAWEMGAVLNYGKDYLMTQYAPSLYTKYAFEIFHWFGDPTMQIWTEVPKELEVQYEHNLPVGTTSVQITVNPPHSLITLSKKGSPYGEILNKTFSASGPTSISLPKPLELGEEIEVTVTKHNYRPHEGKMTVLPKTGCNFPTIRLVRSGFWSTPSIWEPARVPDSQDTVLIQKKTPWSQMVVVGDKDNKIKVETLCLEPNTRLIGLGRFSVRAENIYNQGMIRNLASGPLTLYGSGEIHNQGTIQGGNGRNGWCQGNRVEDYVHAGPGNNVFLYAKHLINDGKIHGGTGGDDITHNCLKEQNIEAKGGQGGGVFVLASTIVNNGLIGSERENEQVNRWWRIPFGNNGGIGSNKSEVGRKCLSWGQPGEGLGHIIELGQLGRNYGGAYGGYGGHTYVMAVTRLSNANTGRISSGYGGDARQGECKASSGKAGNLIAYSPILDNEGIIAAGKNGRALGEPEIVLTGPSMRFEESKEVILFGGDHWELDLKNLSHDAITALEQITLAVGQGGKIDLRGNTTRILNAGVKVDLFSDTILLDEGVSLKDLINAPTIETHPSKVLYEVALAGPGTITGEPQTTVPLDFIVINSGPTVDTYTLTVTNSAGWPLGTLPSTLTVEGLQQVNLPLDVTLPETLGATNTLSITATSQTDPNVKATTEMSISVEPHADLELVKASGQIMDEQGQPLAGATVQIEENVTTTDDQGHWEIPDLLNGHYTTLISKGEQIFVQDLPVDGHPTEVTFKPTEMSQDVEEEGEPKAKSEGEISSWVQQPIEDVASPFIEELVSPLLALPTACPLTGTINFLCNNRGQVITNATLGPSAIVSGGELAGKIDNHGFVSQVTLQPDSLLEGGSLSGYVINHGTLKDIEFVGASVQGGTLAGTITNVSKVGGTVIDVTFAPNAHLKGGKLQGKIQGDKAAPALLESVKVLKGSELSGVELGQGVIQEEGVTFKE